MRWERSGQTGGGACGLPMPCYAGFLALMMPEIIQKMRNSGTAWQVYVMLRDCPELLNKVDLRCYTQYGAFVLCFWF